MFKTYRFIKNLVAVAAVDNDLDERQNCLDRIRYNHANNGKVQLVADRIQTEIDARRKANEEKFNALFAA